MMLGKYFKKTVFRKEHTADGVVPEAPQGILKKCNACKGAIFTEDVKRNLYICPKCGNYFRVHAYRRIEFLLDDGSFEEWDQGMTAGNPLGFPGYEEKVRALQERTGLTEAVVTGKGRINGMETVIGVCDGRFMMASMGEAVGEKITRAVERATKLSLPVILSYLLQQVYSISDAAIVGQTLTAQEVAGVNDTTSLVFIFLQFAFGVSAGFCVVTSCQVGARNQAGVRRSLATQIILSAVLTVLLTALALALLNPMLAWINVTPDNAEVYQAAYTYCFIIFAGIGAQLFYNFICAFLRSMGDSLTPLLFLLFSTVLNVGLDLLFIMVFRWGVAGAAIATVAAQLISTVACFIYAFAKYPQLRLHREDMRITRGDIRRHVVQGVPLGLQFSVLAIGIIVMQGVVVQFDMLDGVMVSSSAQMGFGAANKLFNLTATPMNALGTAMTSFTAQNLGAGNHDRIRKGALQSLVMVSLLAAMAVGIGLLLTLGNAYLRIFLSADKITMDTVRYGNTFLYVDYAMYLFLGFIFVVRNCIQGIGRSRFVLGAGAAELVARIAVCLTLPAAVAGGVVSAQANSLAFYALCAADPMAWIAADIVLAIPFFRNILRRDYRYMNI